MTPLTLPDSKNHYAIGDLFRTLVMIHCDQYIDREDIAVCTYDEWDFYQVSVFRWSKTGPGCGTKEMRDVRWENQKTAIRGLFEQTSAPDASWYWPSERRPEKLDIEDGKSVPGVMFSIKKNKR